MTIAIVQKASNEAANAAASNPLTTTLPSPSTPGNQLWGVSSYNLGNPAVVSWPPGWIVVTDTDPFPASLSHIAVAYKTSTGDSSLTITRTGGDRHILHLFELPPSSYNSYVVADGTGEFPSISPTGTNSILLLAVIASTQGYSVTGTPAGWTLEQSTQANTGSNSTVLSAFSRVVAPGTGPYGGTVTYSSGVGTSAIALAIEEAGAAPPNQGPQPPVVYDPDDVELATLTEAFDIKIRIELNGTGSGQFSINRHSADALAAALKPGNYVRVAIPQIDGSNPIFGFFLEGGTVKVVSADEEGGETVTFGGRGGLAYWDRAIWLNESFLVDWVPASIRAAHGAPPAGTIGAVRYAAGDYRRFTVSSGAVTSRTDFSTGGFSSYYDRKIYVSDGVGGMVTLIHLTTGGVSGWWVRPYGAGVTDFPKKSMYRFGPSIAMQSITANRTPGEVIYVMWQEATDPARPIAPLPLMTVDFDDTLDSDGNAWTVTDGVNGVSADLGEDYLSTIGKLTNLGVVDVVMGPDLDMHAYNAYGRDLHSATYAANKVRFEKAVNIADELSREYSDSPVGTFAEVLGSQDGVVARVELADAATRTPREISVRGDSDDVDALEALGLSDLEARLLHSDAIGFNVATPIIGQEDELAGLYLPGPPGSANGNYWIGDLVTLNTGTGEHDFNEVTVRIAAISIAFTEANSMVVTVEVNSGFGGYQPNGGSTGASTSTTGGGTSGTLSDLYQLVSERDLPNGYPSLDDDSLVSASQLPTQWKQSVRAASTANGTLATAYENGDTLDGVTLATGDQILLKDQTTGADNGIYVVNATGAPTRRADFDADVDALGAVVMVRQGTVNAGTAWRLTNTTVPTIGTTALTWSQFGAGGGGGSGTLTTIEEVDGSPTDSAVTKLVFPNGTLAIASHVATYTPAGGGGGPSDYVSGPSGSGQIVVPDWTVTAPTTVRGLSTWFAADHLSGYSDGDPVLQWPNSAPGMIGGDGDGVASPVYKTGIVNSLPIVRFNGSTQAFRLYAPGLATFGVSIFVVFKLANLTPSYAGLIGNSVASDIGGWFVKSNGKTAFYSGATNIYDGTGSITYGTTNWNYSTLVYGGGTFATRRNASADASGTNTGALGWADNAQLANQAVGGRFMACDVAELLIYSRKVTSAEITTIESYLSGKYAL